MKKYTISLKRSEYVELEVCADSRTDAMATARRAVEQCANPVEDLEGFATDFAIVEIDVEPCS